VDLEQRVQNLEQEVQILKNQIQASLLAIQEQLLTNAYPALRAQEQESDTSPASPNPPLNVATVAPNPPLNVATVAPLRDDDERSDDTLPSVRKVTLEEIQAKKKSAPHNTPVRAAATDEWGKLEDWARRQVDKVGLQRTIELIQAYTEQGRFTPETQEGLFHALGITPQVYHSLMPPPVPRPVSVARPAAPAKPAPQSRNRAQPKPTPRAKNGAPPKPASPVSTTPQSSARPAAAAPEAEVDRKSNLVLRLIAGVNNAGAGVRWKKE
jgi:hypothetical protein